MTKASPTRGIFTRTVVLVLIGAFFGAQFGITASPSVVGSTPAALGIVTLALAAALVAPWLGVVFYCLAVAGMAPVLYQAPMFFPWIAALAILLLTVRRLPAISLAPPTDGVWRKLLAKGALALLASLLYVCFAALPALLVNGQASKLPELAGAMVLLLQVAPLLILLLQREARAKLAPPRDRLAEHGGWWALTLAVFAYVGTLGEQWSILGLVDGSILLGPLMVWAALRLNYASVAAAVLLVPQAASTFQLVALGGTPAPAIVLGTSGVTILSLSLVIGTWALFGWRYWMLRSSDGPEHASLRSAALSSGCLLIAGVVAGIVTVKQSNWQTDFVAKRFAKETVRVLDHIEDGLLEILDSTSAVCSPADLALLNDRMMGTAFVLYFGMLDETGKEICSSGSGISSFVAPQDIPAGRSYLFSRKTDADVQSIILVVRPPGKTAAYALLDMPSITWYLQGSLEGRREAVALSIGGHELFNRTPEVSTGVLGRHEVMIFDPDFLVAARITAGREVIASSITPTVAVSEIAIVVVYIIMVLVGELRVRESVAKQKTEAENKARSAFLAIMSHEIRTPLNGLIGNLELLQLASKGKRAPDDEVKSVALNDAFTSSRALLAIINDVLDMSKIEAGGMTLDLQPTHLREIISATLRTHAVTAKEKGLTLVANETLHLAQPVVAAPVRLQQILSNLVSNAIKFTSTGSVTLSVTEQTRRPHGVVVQFSVSDTGPGIDKEFLPHLFAPFRRAHRDEHVAGTGLGLSICNNLVRLMGGTLLVDNAPGKGARFHFTLFFPYATGKKRSKRPSGSKKTERKNTHPGNFAKLPILIVDDHPLTQELLSRQLALLGLRAKRAASMAEAIACIEAEGPFAGIITDENMPGGNGTDLAKALRRKKHGTLAQLPIILCTSDLTTKADALLENGTLDGILYKPYDLAGLEACLSAHFPLQDVAQPTAPSGGQGGPEATAGYTWADGDTVSLLMTVDNNWNNASAMLDKLHVATDADLAALAHCLSQEDAAGVAKAAHRIKGASQIIGATRLASAVKAIEDAARTNDLAACKALLEEAGDANQALHEFAKRIRT